MKTVLILSGGMDSTTLLHALLAEGDQVLAVGVDYGQRHRKELQAAQAICAELGVEFRIADLAGVRQFLGGSSQTDDSVQVPEGHYAEEAMKLTVVPNRNMLMLALAAAWAISLKADRVAYAAHGGDHTIYPDCRPEFVQAMGVALGLADWHEVELFAPFLSMSKADIASLGSHLAVPFERTWSCYKGGDKHCGKCGTCVERREAFSVAGLVDPTEYE